MTKRPSGSCNRPHDQSHSPSAPHKFLGIAEDETSNEGPVGLIGGQSIQVSKIEGHEVPFADKLAISASRVVAEEQHNGFVYWAVKEQRDVPSERYRMGYCLGEIQVHGMTWLREA